MAIRRKYCLYNTCVERRDDVINHTTRPESMVERCCSSLSPLIFFSLIGPLRLTRASRIVKRWKVRSISFMKLGSYHVHRQNIVSGVIGSLLQCLPELAHGSLTSGNWEMEKCGWQKAATMATSKVQDAGILSLFVEQRPERLLQLSALRRLKL